MKAFRLTREQVHKLGARPDGKGGVIRLTDDEWKARVGALAHGNEPPKVARPPIRVTAKHTPNATEARYGDILRVRYQEYVVLYEPLSFRLLSGALFTPDWVVLDGPTIVAAWEVKGAWGHHSHSRSALAWKTAAHEWPMILWGWAVWRNREWLETEILSK